MDRGLPLNIVPSEQATTSEDLASERAPEVFRREQVGRTVLGPVALADVSDSTGELDGRERETEPSAWARAFSEYNELGAVIETDTSRLARTVLQREAGEVPSSDPSLIDPSTVTARQLRSAYLMLEPLDGTLTRRELVELFTVARLGRALEDTTDETNQNSQLVKAGRTAQAIVAEQYIPLVQRRSAGDVRIQDDVRGNTAISFTKSIWESMALPTLSHDAVCSWLNRVYSNKRFDEYRASARSRASLYDLEDLAKMAPESPELKPEAALEQAELARVARELLATLPERQQEILRMRIMDEMSSDEVAVVFGASPVSIRVAQHRALNRLRELVREGDYFQDK